MNPLITIALVATGGWILLGASEKKASTAGCDKTWSDFYDTIKLKAETTSENFFPYLADIMEEAGYQEAANCIRAELAGQPVECKQMVIKAMKEDFKKMSKAKANAFASLLESGGYTALAACLRQTIAKK